MYNYIKFQGFNYELSCGAKDVVRRTKQQVWIRTPEGLKKATRTDVRKPKKLGKGLVILDGFQGMGQPILEIVE